MHIVLSFFMYALMHIVLSIFMYALMHIVMSFSLSMVHLLQRFATLSFIIGLQYCMNISDRRTFLMYPFFIVPLTFYHTLPCSTYTLRTF
jgi:ABC-type transport system involved in cytochrome c biogenesis permease component